MNIAPTDFISCRNLQSVLEFSLSLAIALSGTGLGNIQLVDWKTGRMTIAAQFGFQERFLSFFRHVIATDSCACGRALRTRNTVLIEDIDQDEDLHGCRTILREAGVLRRTVNASHFVEWSALRHPLHALWSAAQACHEGARRLETLGTGERKRDYIFEGKCSR